MPLIATKGAASAQGFGEFAQSGPAVYIEDVFSTYLYTGNATNRTITNGIDLAGKGGMVWTKQRVLSQNHLLFDTARGVGNRLNSNTSNANEFSTTTLTSFNSDGFSLGTSADTNRNNEPYASWTFRKQPKFFDVVTYTGNGANRTIAHNLGSAPGCILVKSTSLAGTNWAVYHRSLTSAQYALQLNNTGAELFKTAYWNSTAPTSTVFTLGNDTDVNENGATYVAYLFAHNAGGFGLTGLDNVISCGSYTGNGSATGPVVTLGYEPQWVLVKNASVSGNNWLVFDTMRGMSFSTSAYLRPNTTDPESIGTGWIIPQATGFQLGTTVSSINGSGSTYIYIAIRRGPMKTPTSGTSVFAPVQYTTSPEGFITGFPVDFGIAGAKSGTDKWYWQSRLQGAVLLNSASTAAEVGSGSAKFDMMNGYGTGFSTSYWTDAFRRAPGFFDVVCYTGTGSATTFSHNLGVVPEMMIVKRRSTADNWFVYSQTLGNTKHIALDGNGGASGNNIAYWNNTSPTASVFSVGNDSAVNASASTYVNYLFASCPGVSKVGSYTGTGTTKQIDCGFTGGARFVLIKRTDSTGDWYVWDSARGIVAGNDPYLLLNSTAAEVTNTDYVDTYSAGFEISSTAPAAINANGGTFIFLAIA